MTLKKRKKKVNQVCYSGGYLKNLAGDLFSGAQYACLSTRSQLIFSSSWLWILGVWILTLS